MRSMMFCQRAQWTEAGADHSCTTGDPQRIPGNPREIRRISPNQKTGVV